jgi:hypothetical protein
MDPIERRRYHGPGPFRTENLREDCRYELSDGHPIYCAPAGQDVPFGLSGFRLVSHRQARCDA